MLTLKPCREEEGRSKPPAVMMSVGSKPGFVSVLVPDFSFWGNERGLLARVSDGRGTSGSES